jgi:hypothetical protein
MRTLSFLVGILGIVMGLLGIFQPDLLVSVGRYSLAAPGLYVVGAARLIIGLILFLGARTSRAPTLLRILGVAICIGGVVIAGVTVARSNTLLDWWSIHGPGFIGVGAIIVLVLGSLVVYATAPRKGNS